MSGAQAPERAYKLVVHTPSENVGLKYAETPGGFVYIAACEEGTAAERAGVTPGYLLRINDRQILSVNDLRYAVGHARKQYPSELVVVIGDNQPQPSIGWLPGDSQAVPQPRPSQAEHPTTPRTQGVSMFTAPEKRASVNPPPPPSDPPSNGAASPIQRVSGVSNAGRSRRGSQSSFPDGVNTLLPAMEFFRPSRSQSDWRVFDQCRSKLEGMHLPDSLSLPRDDGFWPNLTQEVNADQEARVGDVLTLGLGSEEVVVNELWLAAFVDAWYAVNPHLLHLRNAVSDIQFRVSDAFWAFLCDKGAEMATGDLAVFREGHSTDVLRPVLPQWNAAIREWGTKTGAGRWDNPLSKETGRSAVVSHPVSQASHAPSGGRRAHRAPSMTSLSSASTGHPVVVASSRSRQGSRVGQHQQPHHHQQPQHHQQHPHQQHQQHQQHHHHHPQQQPPHHHRPSHHRQQPSARARSPTAPSTPPQSDAHEGRYYPSPHRAHLLRAERLSYHTTLPPAAQRAAYEHERLVQRMGDRAASPSSPTALASSGHRGASPGVMSAGPSLPSLSPGSPSSPGPQSPNSRAGRGNPAREVQFDVDECFNEI